MLGQHRGCGAPAAPHEGCTFDIPSPIHPYALSHAWLPQGKTPTPTPNPTGRMQKMMGEHGHRLKQAGCTPGAQPHSPAGLPWGSGARDCCSSAVSSACTAHRRVGGQAGRGRGCSLAAGMCRTRVAQMKVQGQAQACEFHGRSKAGMEGVEGWGALPKASRAHVH